MVFSIPSLACFAYIQRGTPVRKSDKYGKVSDLRTDPLDCELKKSVLFGMLFEENTVSDNQMEWFYECGGAFSRASSISP